MELLVSGEVWYWRGPAPYHFVSVPEAGSAALREASPVISYGWGVVPVTVELGGTTWTTSLFPRGDRYAVPLKAAVRRAEGVELGDTVALRLVVAGPGRAHA